jgi:hypothetical protein
MKRRLPREEIIAMEKNMRIVILTNNAYSWHKTIADGLEKMLKSIGEEAIVLYDGHHIMNLSDFRAVTIIFSNIKSACKNLIKYFFNKIFQKRYSYQPLTIYYRSLNIITKSNLVIVIGNVPDGFLKKYLRGIEELRLQCKIPIVAYMHYNLATRGNWFKRIFEEYECGGFGLERYDWYLSASVVSEFPMPKCFEFFSLIGMDIRDQNLFPEKNNKFLAVLDFVRKGFEKEREIQISALQETNTPFIVLDKPMTRDEIRAIYRKASLFFLSFRESFGLPIVELQLCGSYICTPYKNWAPSHYINKSIYNRYEGDLSKNFIVYNNDKDVLKREIRRIRASYNPTEVIEEFKNKHPHLYKGDLNELRVFIEKVRSGNINSTSHEHYVDINKQIVTENT